MMEEDKKKDSEEAIDEEKEQEKDAEETEEDEELFTDDEEFEEDQGDSWERTRTWIQDNLRVILSVLIVVLIAVGIYNYSNKPEEQPSKVDQLVGDQLVENQQLDQGSQGSIEINNANENNGQVVVKEEEKKAPTAPAETTPPVPTETKAEKSGEGYQVQAASGDGVTHLARKAAKEYLNNNPDAAGLTKEHKIYIEDYLRKHVNQGKLKIGDSRSFSDSLIKEAISKSKQLNERQLNNLQRYSARVSNL